MQVAALERKQMELMLNNSMKKIEQLLSLEIDLKRTVADLKLKLEEKETNSYEHELAVKKHRDEVALLTRNLE